MVDSTPGSAAGPNSSIISSNTALENLCRANLVGEVQTDHLFHDLLGSRVVISPSPNNAVQMTTLRTLYQAIVWSRTSLQDTCFPEQHCLHTYRIGNHVYS